MAVYTVHLPNTGDRPADAERAVFVPEAFSWGALIWGPLWLLLNRSWVGLLVWLILAAATAALAVTLHAAPATMAFAALAVAIFFGFEARQLKRISLQHRGYALADVVSARNLRDAEQAFFLRWLAQDEAAPSVPFLPLTRPLVQPSEDFLGLFPDAGGRQ